MATRIKLRRDTAANWLESNPILAQGETGFETDTRMMKLGDGTTRWADLKYAVTGNLKVTDNTIHGDDVVSVSSGMGDRSNWVLTVNTIFEGPSNGYITAVDYDSEGNAFTSGIYGPEGDAPGMFLIKTDPNGEVLFKNYYSEMYAFGYSMIVDGNDDVLFVMAEFAGDAADTVLAKVSGIDGTIMWQKYLADTDNYSDDVAICLDIDPDNNVILAGTTATGGNTDFWVAKFNGATGAAIWQKQYDSDGCEDSAGGIAVDSQGNIGVVGTSYGPGTFLGLFKLDGSNGDVIWQKRVINANVQANEEDPAFSGQAWVNGDLFSSDICVDSNDDFYFNLTGIYCYSEATVGGIHKISSSGEWKWSKVISYNDYLNGSSAVICDSDNNVYLSSTIQKYGAIGQYGITNRVQNVITKFNASGRKLWSKSLSREQAEVTGAYHNFGNTTGLGQTIAVNDDYVLLGGMSYQRYSYSSENQSWYDQPFLAQLDKAGTDFVKDGWIYKDNTFKIFNMTAATDDDGFLNDLTESTADIVVTTGDITADDMVSTVSLAHINVSRVKTMTLEGDRLHLPENGGLALSRKHIGHITSIGKFDLDGNEGNNIGGDTWINGVTGDTAGNVYAAGGWYINYDWNDDTSYENIPLIWKIDSEGAIVWSAGNNLNQWGADMVDVAYNAEDDTIIAIGHDNEDYNDYIDGHEGFNLFTLDASTGTLKQVKRVHPTLTSGPSGSSDMTVNSLVLKSDGTPVVVGYINNSFDEFENVTSGGAGLPGSGTGILVINKSVFDRGEVSVDVVYPDGVGFWYIGGSVINYVNRYASVASVNTTLEGTGAKFNIVLASGPTATVTIASGFAGIGYRAGNRFTIAGTGFPGGTSPTNDLVFEVGTVDGNGSILTVNTVSWSDDGGFDAYGTYTEQVATRLVGADATFTVTANPATNAYTATTASGGTNYSVGDTVKVLGSLLGGIDTVDDAEITVTAVSSGAIDTISVAGTGQETRIKLDVGGGTDFTQSGTYNVWHETDGDGFIWTPDWQVVIGGEENYDVIYSVAVDSDDNIVVSGSSENLNLPANTTDWNNYAQTAFIAKYDKDGERQWAKAVDGHEGNNTVWGVTTDSDGNIYGVMSGFPYDSNWDPSVIKLDADGNFVWKVQINYWNEYGNTWSIAIDADQNIIISGEQTSQETSTDRIGYNNNIQIAKMDRDGNPLWKRLLWSNNGMYTGYNDWYGNNLAVVGDKFVWGGVSSRWNDNDDDIAVVAQLPLGGTGSGNIGNYYYDEIEVNFEHLTENDYFGGDVLIVRDVANRLPSRQYTFVEEDYATDLWESYNNQAGTTNGYSGPMTLYANLDGKVEHVLEEGGGDITGVKEIVFEDGTRQSTTAQDIPQVDVSITNRGDDDYYLRIEDRGHHIYMDESQGVDIVIPNALRVPFPVGTSIVIVTNNLDINIYAEGNLNYMRGAGLDQGSYSWNMPRYSMVTLLKVVQGYNTDGTPSEYGEWMIAGPGITSN